MEKDELVGSVIFICLTIVAGVFLIRAANIRTEKLEQYWSEQQKLCGEASYYSGEQGRCVQVEYMKNLEI